MVRFTPEFDPARVAWVLEEEALARMVEQVAMAHEVILDLETTGLQEWAVEGGAINGGVGARVVLASCTLPMAEDDLQPGTWVIPLSHPDSPWQGRWRQVLGKVAAVIRDEDRTLVNQNVKFDARWIYATTGVDVSRQIVWDTLVGSHLLDETTSTKLKERVPAVFGIQRWDDFDLSTPGAAERVPLFDLGMYAARDTFWDWALARHQRALMYPEDHPETPDEVEEARLGLLASWCAMPTVATLTAVEQRGIQLDLPWVRENLAEHRAEHARLFRELSQRYPGLDGEPSFAPTSYWFRDWTQKAIEAGDLRVGELTPTGKPTWRKGVLVRQARGGSDVAVDLLAMRSHAKKIEYLESWLALASARGRIHTTYNVGRVVTGRLSSDTPNMQQVTATLKPAFVPSAGYYLAEFDYSQIEMRAAAHISGCVPMIEAFLRGDDLHTLLGARITGKPLEEVTKEDRQSAKSANFGLLYGLSAYGFMFYAEEVYGIVFTTEEAEAIHRAFFSMWEGLSEWHARTRLRAAQMGQVVSPIGRVRRLPDIHDPWRQKHAENAAVNAPVQGFASDLMQMAAASIEGLLPGQDPVPGVRLVGTVHDSIVAEIPVEGWREHVDQCIARMVDLSRPLGRMGVTLAVPLAVEAKVGTRWGLSDIGVVEGSNLAAMV